MKRICFCGHFTAGGTEKATFLLANELKDNFEVHLINTCDNAPTFYLKPDLKMDYLSGKKMRDRIKLLTRYIKQNKIDILISVEAMTGIIALPAAKLAGCKLIIWEHANYYQTQGSRYIQKIRQLELYLSDAYVVLTKRDYNNFNEHFKIKCKLTTIYNVAEISKSCDEYDAESKIILSAGHLREIKNFMIIPDIGKIVFEKHPDWKWHIYGSSVTDYGDRLQKKIQEYGLSNNIILCGRSDDMDKAYNSAAMYVMTSKMEGLPMVILEAKSHNLPVISFDIETGPDEMIENGVNGYLIEPYDIEKMAERICELIEDKKNRKNFSTHSKDGMSKFQVNAIVKQWHDILND